MDRETDKKLDEYVGKVVRDTTMEEPSLNFTSKIMGQINTAPNASMFEYKPLISKYVWMILAFGVVAVFAFTLFNGGGLEYDGMPFFDLKRWSDSVVFESLSQIKLANTLVYGVIGFAFFACLQIVLLKRRFDKRFSLS